MLSKFSAIFTNNDKFQKLSELTANTSLNISVNNNDKKIYQAIQVILSDDSTISENISKQFANGPHRSPDEQQI